MCADIQAPVIASQKLRLGSKTERKRPYLFDNGLSSAWDLSLPVRLFELVLFVQEVLVDLEVGQDGVL